MEIKEVVNIKALKEKFYDVSDSTCDECPLLKVCKTLDKGGYGCVASEIINPVDNRDLYDMELDGTLTEDYQLGVAIC